MKKFEVEHWVYGVIALWFILGFGPYACSDNSGRFGDTFGAVNALFSGLAFVGVIYAIVLQRKELALQRKELNANTQAQKGQEKQLKRQSDYLAEQAFVSNYFRLLDNCDKMHSLIWNHEQNPNSMRGDQVIDKIIRDFKSNVWSQFIRTDFPDAKYINARGHFHKHYKNEGYDKKLRVYISSILEVLKYVDAANIPNKQFYFQLVGLRIGEEFKAILGCCVLTIDAYAKYQQAFRNSRIAEQVAIQFKEPKDSNKDSDVMYKHSEWERELLKIEPPS